jgi:hypothetical protein
VSYALGEHCWIDGVEMQLVALGCVTDDGVLEINEGTTILADGPEALIEFLDDDERTVAVWRDVEVLAAEEQAEMVRLEIDGRLVGLRALLTDWEGRDEAMPLSMVAAYLRAAYGRGYVDALQEEQPELTAMRLGLNDPEKEW